MESKEVRKLLLWQKASFGFWHMLIAEANPHATLQETHDFLKTWQVEKNDRVLEREFHRWTTWHTQSDVSQICVALSNFRSLLVSLNIVYPESVQILMGKFINELNKIHLKSFGPSWLALVERIFFSLDIAGCGYITVGDTLWLVVAEHYQVASRMQVEQRSTYLFKESVKLLLEFGADSTKNDSSSSFVTLQQFKCRIQEKHEKSVSFSLSELDLQRRLGKLQNVSQTIDISLRPWYDSLVKQTSDSGQSVLPLALWLVEAELSIAMTLTSNTVEKAQILARLLKQEWLRKMMSNTMALNEEQFISGFVERFLDQTNCLVKLISEAFEESEQIDERKKNLEMPLTLLERSSESPPGKALETEPSRNSKLAGENPDTLGGEVEIGEKTKNMIKREEIQDVPGKCLYIEHMKTNEMAMSDGPFRNRYPSNPLKRQSSEVPLPLFSSLLPYNSYMFQYDDAQDQNDWKRIDVDQALENMLKQRFERSDENGQMDVQATSRYESLLKFDKELVLKSGNLYTKYENRQWQRSSFVLAVSTTSKNDQNNLVLRDEISKAVLEFPASSVKLLIDTSGKAYTIMLCLRYPAGFLGYEKHILVKLRSGTSMLLKAISPEEEPEWLFSIAFAKEVCEGEQNITKLRQVPLVQDVRGTTIRDYPHHLESTGSPGLTADDEEDLFEDCTETYTTEV